ncbi:bacterio-opsin activator domain-containing protein [Halomarina ordinaria]|uniref:Bacterio-opsin activator domain-containing protein n=1 Tax=Halomarina ordinaria TaxID=3033939 RepID=A0ABD5UBM4_9EURY|nr:bacterio-opsin activator domain-containing protein [Halomarina sp. PSRA2]
MGERSYRETVEQAGHAVARLDTEGRIVDVNRAFETLTGYDEGDVAGESYRTLLPATHDEPVERIKREVRAGETWRGTLTIARASGELSTLDQTVAPVTVDGSLDHLAVVAAPIDHPEREVQVNALATRLGQLERLTAAVRPIVGTLLNAATREDIHQPLCDQLVEATEYDVAWLADYRPESEEVVLRAATGETGMVSQAASTVEGPVARALRSRTVQVVEDPADRPSMPFAGTTAGRDTRLDVLVPLSYGETTYGVLGLSADRERPVTPGERTLLSELGGTVGYAYHAIENRRLLLTDTVVELEFRSTDRTLHAVDTSAEFGARFELRSLVPATDGALLAYVEVSDVDPARIGERMGESPDIREFSVIRADADSALVQCQLVDGFLALTIAEYGANLTSLVIEDGVLNAVCEVTPQTDVRSFVEHVTTTYPETELVRKQERPRPHGPVREDGAGDDDAMAGLTERQREALEAAYRAGYFEWARESTAEEVAAAMNISAPTFHKHLRKGLNGVMASLFETYTDG